MPHELPHATDDASSSDSPPLRVQQQIDRICEEFIRAWQGEPKPSLESYLSLLPAESRPWLLRELLAEELDLRCRAGHSIFAAEYYKRFPVDNSTIDQLFHSLEQSIESKAASGTTTKNMLGERGPTVDPPLPAQIGRYQVVRRIGMGGFGIVYLGTDPELRREVALKVPRPERFDSEREQEWFIEEARTAARLNHPGIVAIYDILRDGQTVCVVQEYVAGPDLGHWLAGQQQPIPPQQAALLVAEIAEVVAFAHQQSFVHRDLKPANILMDSKGRPRIADFGLALRDSARRRSAGERSGTPSYMSPEQVRGEAHRLDGRSDIWSVGVILYELLTGRRPFQGATHDELYEDILESEPKPPRQMHPDLPVALETICLKCLSKQPSDRYTTGKDLANDLRSVLEEMSIGGKQDLYVEPPTPPIYKPKNPARMGCQIAIAATISFVLILSAGLASLSIFGHRNVDWLGPILNKPIPVTAPPVLPTVKHDEPPEVKPVPDSGAENPPPPATTSESLIERAEQQPNAKSSVNDGPPLIIDIEKPGATKWTLSELPAGVPTYLEILRIEGFEPLQQEPKTPVAVGESILVGVGPNNDSLPLLLKLVTSLSQNTVKVELHPLIKLDGWSEARPYRARELLELEPQLRQNLNGLRDQLLTVTEASPRSPETKLRREMAINRLKGEQATLLNQIAQMQFVWRFADTPQGSARIHFRVFALDGAAKDELLQMKTEIKERQN